MNARSQLLTVLAICAGMLGFAVASTGRTPQSANGLRLTSSTAARTSPPREVLTELHASKQEARFARPGARRKAQAVARSPRVSGRVLDEHDRAVSGVTVVLYRGRARHAQLSDSEGRYAFEELAGGRYQAYIEQRSLPEGFLPPWRQQVPRPAAENPTGMFGTTFELDSNAPSRVDLRVFHRASLRGLVQDEAGRNVAGARVRVRSEDGVRLEARSGEDGAFEIERAWPGEYVVLVGDEERGHEFQLSAGEDRALPMLLVSSGS